MSSFLELFAKIFIPAVALVLFTWFLGFIRSLLRKEKKNEMDEISLLGKKIEIDNSQKSIDRLTDESNKKHGVGLGQDETGTPDKKE